MEIIFHAHHANVSDRMRKRAESAVRRVARRMARAVDGIIRFEQDGPVKRVEIVLHAPRQRDLIARGEGRYFGPAFAGAMRRFIDDPDLVESMGKAGRRFAGRFTWDYSADQTSEHLSKVVQRGR